MSTAWRVREGASCGDTFGWRPTEGMTDKLGNVIEDRVYTGTDMNRRLCLRSLQTARWYSLRSSAIARRARSSLLGPGAQATSTGRLSRSIKRHGPPR
jgi:hypothetical protein